MQNRRIVVSLPRDLYEQLEEVARAEDRIVEQQIRAIIRRSLDRAEKDEQPQEEACPQ